MTRWLTDGRVASRVGRFGTGSRGCLQRAVEHDLASLSDVVVAASPSLAAFGVTTLAWKSPIPKTSFLEYRDDFLEPLGLERHKSRLREFWPSGGPQWDGLAVVPGHERTGYLLVEAKAHPAETGSDCAAGPDSLALIREALARTQGAMGVAPRDWTKGAYQLANRLAYLHFLNDIVGEPTWLALIGFVNDATHRPTSRSQWVKHQADLFHQLGLHPGCRLLDRVILVTPEALPAE